MRVTYGRELKLSEKLSMMGIANYVPTRMKDVRRPSDGKLVRKRVSAISNLLFIYGFRSEIQDLKEQMEATIPMRYMMDKSTGYPMVVPDRDMADFIRVTADDSKDVIWLDNPEAAYAGGQRVEIVYGPFSGIRGYVLRVNRDRKVVVTINGLASVALIIEMKPQWLKRI